LQGRTAEAVAQGLRATAVDGRRAEYWHVLGLAQLAAQRLPESALALERAIRMKPYDVRYVGDLARVTLLMGGAGSSDARARAIALAEQAVWTDPNNPLSHVTRALVMQVSGDVPEALSAIERAMTLDPQSDNSSLYVTATQIYAASGRPVDAIRVANLGLGILYPPQRSVDLRVELARALVAAGQPTTALLELDAALAIRPGYRPAEQLRSELRRPSK